MNSLILTASAVEVMAELDGGYVLRVLGAPAGAEG